VINMYKKVILVFVVLLSLTLTGCEEDVYEVATTEEITEMNEEVSDIDGLYIGLLNGSTVTNSTNIKIQNDVITITSGGTYTLVGTLDDGQIVVDTSDEVTLNLNGVSINNDNGPAIYIEDADGGTTIYLEENTVNTLSDGETHSDEELTAVLYSKDNLIIDGLGTLIVEANYNDGIVSKDSLLITNGLIEVTSVSDGIYGKDDLVIEGGTFTITTGEGSANAPVIVEEMGQGRPGRPGSTTTSTVEETDEGSFKALKSQGTITINGGTFMIDSYDDGIHSDTEIEINGGDITILSGDDAIHSNNLLTVNGGVIDINYSCEGLESFSIIINQGIIDIYAYDDGINATNGTNTSVGGTADHPDNGDYDLESDPHIIQNGGTLTVVSDGDGVDANGVVIFNGGIALVNGKGTASGMIESPIDFDITGVVNGGTIMATGTSTMAYEFDDVKSTQNSFKVTFSGFYSANTTIDIQTSDGTSIGSMTTTNSFETLIFSSSELVQGETYTLVINSDSYTLTLSTLSSVTVAS